MAKSSIGTRNASDKAQEREHQNFWMDYEFYSQTIDTEVYDWGDKDGPFCDAIGLHPNLYKQIIRDSKRHFVTTS